MASAVSAWWFRTKTYDDDSVATTKFDVGADVYFKSLQSWTASHTGCKNDKNVRVYFVPDTAFGENFPESQAFAESVWNATIILDNNGYIPLTKTWTAAEIGHFDILIYGEQGGQGCILLVQSGINVEDKYSFGVIPEFSTMTAGLALLGGIGFIFLRRRR